MSLVLNIEGKLRRLSAVSLIITLMLSTIVVIGWVTNHLIFAQFGLYYKPMPLIGALGMFLVSTAMLVHLYQPRSFLIRDIAKFSLILVMVISLVMFIDDFTGFHLNIEQWFLIFPVQGTHGESRISPFMLLILCLSGLATFILKDGNKTSMNIAASLLFVVLLIGFANLLGYVYQSPLLIYVGGSQFTTTALSASMIAIFFSLGALLALGENQPPISFFIGQNLKARLMRNFVPFAIFIFIVDDWIQVNLVSHSNAYAIITAVWTVIVITLMSWLFSKLMTNISNELEQANLKQAKTEETLKEALFYNRGLIEANLDSLVTIDIDGKITDVNEATEIKTGVSRETLIGNDFSQYFTNPKDADKGYKQVFKKGFVKDYPLTLQSVSGQKTDVLYNAVVYKNRSGQISGVFAAARDITELKKAMAIANKYAEELERSNKELQQFAYIASHDLQEPLRVISNYLQLIEHRYKDKLDKDANEFIEFAVNASSRLQRMINDLLIYSRVETQGVAFSQTDLNEVLQHAIDNLEVMIADNHALITHDLLPTLNVDENQIMVVFQNLLANAIKFHKPDLAPQIHLSAEKKDTEWLFSVTDNGIGIDMKYQDKLFIIFKRLVSANYTGNGIGLALCKRIINRHKGKIWVDSALDKGSTFYFTLPE